jgi:uncharacterized protein YfaS (alpha-2-macroglobulin family)
VSCGEEDKGRGDFTEGYGARIDESLIMARVESSSSKMEVELPLASTAEAKGPLSGEVSIDLVKVGEKDAQTTGTSSFTLQKGGTEKVKVTLGGPTFSTLGELGGYVLRYRVKLDEGELYGKRSLFMAASRYGLVVIGQNRFTAGEKGTLRVMTLRPGDGAPISGVPVTVRFQPDASTVAARTLSSGDTDALGEHVASFKFDVKEAGAGTLEVTAGGRKSSHAILVERERNVLLTTDKPLYQPGQTVHIRALAMGQPRLTPTAGESLLIEVEDSQGVKLFKKNTKTDDHGIASLRFQLARLVNLGQYRVRVTMGTTVREKTFTVARYTLPKFKVKVTVDASYYQPGATVTGVVQADYFFGKHVKSGAVTLTARDTAGKPYAEVQGKTSDQGSYAFKVKSPHSVGTMAIEARVEDASGAKVTSGTPVLLAKDSVVLQAVVDGPITPGDPFSIYVLATDPAGKPLSGKVRIKSGAGVATGTAELDASGLAVINATLTSCFNGVQVVLRDGVDLATTELAVTCDGSALRLATDKALYKAGETAKVTVTAPEKVTKVHLDVLQQNATVATHAIEMDQGKGTLSLALQGDLRRTLTLRAHALHDGATLAARRLIFVQGSDQLAITVSTDKKSYRPAETAKVTLEVKSAVDGKPAPGALGVQVVDEALYALTEFKPGLERRFFHLEQEVVEGGKDLKFVSPDVLLTAKPSASDQVRARMLFASANQEATYPINHRSEDDDLPAAIAASRAGLSKLLERMREEFKDKFSSWFSRASKVQMQRWCQDWIDGRYDDFGQPLKVETSGHYASVTSAGMDERWSTGDELTGNLYFSIAEPDDGINLPSSDGGASMMDSGSWGGYADAAAMADAGVPPPPPGSDASVTPGKDAGQQGAPTIRDYFPETLYVNPALITDSQGRAEIDLALADSITSWRLSSIAHTKSGQLGSAAAGITVFQEFFVDALLPTHLVQNDEVEVPVAVYNYLGSAQTVTVTAKKESWFDLQSGASQQVTVPPKSVSAVKFRIKVKQVGTFPFTATGVSTTDSDGVKRSVEVRPDGKRQEIVFSGALEPGSTSHTVTIPAAAIDGASELFVKVYPGLLAEVVEGFEALLAEPHGCFEQTSAATYPNVMVLSYLKGAGISTPELEKKAKGYIDRGYQRLLTYEVAGGGFSLWGHAPADLILSAFGLMEFTDMAEVRYVDEALLKRTQSWLVSQQGADGSFTLPASGYYENAGNMAQDTLRATAYVAWALTGSGYQGAPLDKAISYVKSKIDSADDTYTLAVAANALAEHAPTDPATKGLLAKLKQKAVDDGETSHWDGSGCSMTYGYGKSMTMETTALAVGALLVAKDQSALAAEGLAYLTAEKGALGSYGTTQATVLSLRALLLALSAQGGDKASGTIQVSHNGALQGSAQVTPATSDVTRLFDLKQVVLEGDNKVTIDFAGSGKLAYQVVGIYYLPHGAVPDSGPLAFSVSYDKTSVKVGESIKVTATVKNEKNGKIPTVLLRVGLPPGFTVDEDELTPAKTGGVVQNVEQDASYLVLYLGDVGPSPVSVSLDMTASLAGVFTAPPSVAYPYYTPEYKRTVAMPAVTVTGVAN